MPTNSRLPTTAVKLRSTVVYSLRTVWLKDCSAYRLSFSGSAVSSSKTQTLKLKILSVSGNSVFILWTGLTDSECLARNYLAQRLSRLALSVTQQYRSTTKVDRAFNQGWPSKMNAWEIILRFHFLLEGTTSVLCSDVSRTFST